MPEIDPSRVPESFRPFVSKLLGGPDSAAGLVLMLKSVGRKARRRDTAKMALLLREAFPASSFMAAATNPFVRQLYPSWYIEAVNDDYRNRAYRESLEAVVRPGAVVLEIGTGSGLFSMFAARAGAQHVYTFEADKQVAAIAADNIRRNGLSGAITVIRKNVKDAKLGEDLPAPADVLMHEFSTAHSFPRMGTWKDEVLGELLRPDAPMLPHRFEVRAALCGDEALFRELRVHGRVGEVDVDAINLLALAAMQLPRGAPMQAPLSDPFTAASLDLAAGGGEPERRAAVQVRASAGGTAYGVVRWIAQGFPGGAVYENAPGRHCNWQPFFSPFSEPREVKAGERVRLEVTTLKHDVHIDLDAAPDPDPDPASAPPPDDAPPRCS